MSKRFLVLPFLSIFVLTSCGESPSVGGERNGGLSTSDAGNPGGTADDDTQGDDSDPADDDDDGRTIVDDGDDAPSCEPITCAAVNANCGPVADGCGGLLECGECPEGAECGVETHNVCSVLDDLCEPATRDEACADKQCGSEGDGCGGVHDCGSCEAGEQCGIEVPFQCGVVPDDNPNACEAQIASCAEVGAQCGQIGNGCGGLINCDDELGGCEAGTVCGAAGPSLCGDGPACVPLEPDVACSGKCGIVSNGCGQEVDGGVLDCAEFFPCPDGETCGGAGIPNQCGVPSGVCEPLEEADACEARECGVVGDGCAGQIVCGSCEVGDVCRNGACEPLCLPISQAQACADKECGLVSDGCAGSYHCGDCESGDVCGLIQPFQCDAPLPPECQPLEPTTACQGRECGLVYDGCGTEAANVIDCAALSGGCPAGEYCGAVTPYQCDPPETPPCDAAASCAELGWQCGFAIDDCGNVLDCASEGLSCDPSSETCIGGIDGPTECVSGGDGGPGGSDCDVCDSIPDCSGQPQDTVLTGRVITPGRHDANTANQVGVPNAFVYILRNNDGSELPPIDTGIPSGGTSCDRCVDQDLGPVLVSDTTDSTGSFVLDGNIPIGEEFLLVVKIGKFRRAEAITLDPVAACAETSIDELRTRLPRTRNDGVGAHLPRVAISTGEIDAMECVFEKMGIAASEFTDPGSDGNTAERVHFYRDNDDGGGGRMPGGSRDDADLHSDLNRMLSYDMIVLDCQGGGYDDHDSWDRDLRRYVNRGGRLFASHLSYTWIYDNGNQAYDPSDAHDTGLAPSANWQSSGYPNSGTGIVSIGRPNANPNKIQSFADWLVNENAATLNGGNYTFPIIDPRDLAESVNAPSEEFVYRESGGDTSVQQYAFNTPFGAPEDALCGRVAYSGFHVVGSGGDFDPFQDVIFRDNDDDGEIDYCEGDLSDQEKVLLYMLFDLGACVSEDEPEPPSCTPDVCTQECGTMADGCGGVLSCGNCPVGEVCVAGSCEEIQCTPTTCPIEGATCGLIADGCGGVLDCGNCPAGQQCGLLTPNQCGITCTPNDAQEACEGACGFVSDGCGGVHQCPDCAGTLSCVAGECTDQQCEPTECPEELECGVVSDGCDGTANCGECEAPEVCGGAGIPNRCGVPDCDPLSCVDLDAECGWVGDGCGNALNCGPCPMGQVCGAGGPNQCAGCEPLTCADVGAECGAIGDGCGGIVQCGVCPEGETCGAVVANQCADGPGCTPRSCASIDAECGQIGDGCGGILDCGDCEENEICGIEVAFQCGPPPDCSPTSCDAANAECGSLGDGCGGLLDCGPCPAGFTCGAISPNQCAKNEGEER